MDERVQADAAPFGFADRPNPDNASTQTLSGGLTRSYKTAFGFAKGDQHTFSGWQQEIANQGNISDLGRSAWRSYIQHRNYPNVVLWLFDRHLPKDIRFSFNIADSARATAIVIFKYLSQCCKFFIDSPLWNTPLGLSTVPYIDRTNKPSINF